MGSLLSHAHAKHACAGRPPLVRTLSCGLPRGGGPAGSTCLITNTCGQQVPPGVPVAPSIPKGSVRCVLGVRWGPSPFVHLRGGRKTTKVCPGVFCLGFLSPNGRLRSGRPPNQAVCVWAAARLADVVVSRLVSSSHKFLIWPFTVSLAFYRLLFRGGDRLPFSRFGISTKPTWKRRKR